MRFFNRPAKAEAKSESGAETSRDQGIADLSAMANKFNPAAAEAAQAEAREQAPGPRRGEFVTSAGRRETAEMRLERQQQNIRNQEVLGDPQKEREFIDNIAGNWQRPGDSLEKIMNSLDGMREQKILSYMTGVSPNDYQKMNPANVFMFVYNNPSPIDFERKAADFLQKIEEHNSPAKRRQYEEAMASLQHKIYGKKQEYWEAMKGLKNPQQARAEGPVSGAEGMFMIPGLGGQQEAAQMGRQQQAPRAERRRFFGRQQAPQMEGRRQPLGMENRQQTPRAEGPFAFPERVERKAEWPVGDNASAQLSKVQVVQGMANRVNVYEKNLVAGDTCEDAELVRPVHNLYGVFDGVGGEVNGREASHLASETVDELSKKYNLQSGNDLAWVLNQASARLAANPNAGYSTGVLTKVVNKNGRPTLAWATAGDSRLYIVDKDGNTRQITKDEGEGRGIYNGLGFNESPDRRVTQFGDLVLHAGDRVVLCSDGITGDVGSDLMSNAELGAVVQNAASAEAAAKDLLLRARKRDDRTAVVFQAA